MCIHMNLHVSVLLLSFLEKTPNDCHTINYSNLYVTLLFPTMFHVQFRKKIFVQKGFQADILMYLLV